MGGGRINVCILEYLKLTLIRSYTHMRGEKYKFKSNDVAIVAKASFSSILMASKYERSHFIDRLRLSPVVRKLELELF